MNEKTEKCSQARYARTILKVAIFLVKSDTVPLIPRLRSIWNECWGSKFKALPSNIDAVYLTVTIEYISGLWQIWPNCKVWIGLTTISSSKQKTDAKNGNKSTKIILQMYCDTYLHTIDCKLYSEYIPTTKRKALLLGGRVDLQIKSISWKLEIEWNTQCRILPEILPLF